MSDISYFLYPSANIEQKWLQPTSELTPAIHIFCLPGNKAQAGSCAQYRRETRNKIFHNLLKPHKAIWDAWIFLVMWFWHLFQNIAQASSVSVFFFSTFLYFRNLQNESFFKLFFVLWWELKKKDGLNIQFLG